MGQGLDGSEGRGANALQSGGTAISCDGGALLDSRCAGPIYDDRCPLLCGCMCVRQDCDRVCSDIRLVAPVSASTKRFLFLIMPKRRDYAMSVSASSNDFNKR